MPNREHAAAEQTVKGWGFEHVFTWRDGPYEPQSHTHTQRLLMIFFRTRNAHYPPHLHAGKTTHLILSGTLSIAYPPATAQVVYGAGDRVDVEARRVHEVWMGEEGCVYVVGE